MHEALGTAETADHTWSRPRLSPVNPLPVSSAIPPRRRRTRPTPGPSGASAPGRFFHHRGIYFQADGEVFAWDSEGDSSSPTSPPTSDEDWPDTWGAGERQRWKASTARAHWLLRPQLDDSDESQHLKRRNRRLMVRIWRKNWGNHHALSTPPRTGRSGWIRSLPEDGDVEQNPGPASDLPTAASHDSTIASVSAYLGTATASQMNSGMPPHSPTTCPPLPHPSGPRIGGGGALPLCHIYKGTPRAG